MSVKNYKAGDKQTDLHQAKTKGTKYQAKAKGGVKNEGIGVSQLEDKQNKEITIKEAEVKKDQEQVEQVDKQNKEITIEEAKVKKDQERDELKITIEKAEVIKDHERVKPDDNDVQNEVSQQEYN